MGGGREGEGRGWEVKVNDEPVSQHHHSQLHVERPSFALSRFCCTGYTSLVVQVIPEGSCLLLTALHSLHAAACCTGRAVSEFRLDKHS